MTACDRAQNLVAYRGVLLKRLGLNGWHAQCIVELELGFSATLPDPLHRHVGK